MSRLSSANLCAQSQSCSTTSVKQSGQSVTYGIRDNVHNPTTNMEIILYAMHDIESIPNKQTNRKKEGVNMQLYVITMVRYICGMHLI